MNDQQREEQQERSDRIQSETTPEQAAAQKKRWQALEAAKTMAAARANEEWNRLYQDFLIAQLEQLGFGDSELYIYTLGDQFVDVGLADEYFPYSKADRLSTKHGGNVSVIEAATGNTVYTSDKWATPRSGR